MKKIALLIPVAAAGLALAACSSGSSSTPAAHTSSAPTTTQAPAPTPSTVDAVTTCKGYFGTLDDSDLAERVPDVLGNVSSNMDADDTAAFVEIDDQLDQLISHAQPNLADDLTMIQKPFEQVVNATSGTLTLDMQPMKQGFMKLSQDCADAGFTINGASPTAGMQGTTTDSSSGASAPSDPQTNADSDPAVSPQLSNAISAAKNYLSFSAFSKKGLIQQLSSKYGDQYPTSVATKAVNSLDVNWKEQAVKSAENYLSMTHFSKAGLIQQLESSAGDQYTHSQAVYGATQAMGQ